MSAINVKKKRYIGAFLAGALLLGQLSFQTGSFLVSVSLTVFWLIGGLLGGNLVIIIRRGSGARSWCGVLFGGATSVFLSALLMTGPDDLMGITAAMALPTAILYGFGKIGCRAYGCCGWSESPSGGQHRIPLQTLEAVGSFLLAAILIVIQVTGTAAVTLLAVFLAGHGTQRVLSQLGRSVPLGRAFTSIDSGCLVLCGVYYVF